MNIIIIRLIKPRLCAYSLRKPLQIIFHFSQYLGSLMRIAAAVRLIYGEKL
jgi:hypothetical protein